jgi:predicted nucleotidyltransferase component of viral defense system
MRYASAHAFRQALEQRLKDAAAGNDARLVTARRRVLFYRLLARLASIAGDSWMLKGGLALDLRLPERARATRDVDLDWHAPADQLLDALIDATRHDAGDFLDFAVERTGTPPDRLGGSHRFRAVADLAGRQFDSFQLDVGLREQTGHEVELLRTPDVLAFADVDPPTVAALPIAIQVAEKLHAYTRTYEGNRPSTRVKDLVDLVLVAEFLSIGASDLRDALEGTLENRGLQPVPPSVPEPPTVWRRPFRDLAGTVGAPADLRTAHAVATGMLDPVLDGTVVRGSWDPSRQRWIAD